MGVIFVYKRNGGLTIELYVQTDRKSGFFKCRKCGKGYIRCMNVTPEIAIRLWNEMMKVYFQTDDPDKLERFNRTIEGFCLLKTALIPAIWVNMKEEHKKKSVEAARSYLFPRMEALLDELNEMMI